jgi:hypothetical protein
MSRALEDETRRMEAQKRVKCIFIRRFGELYPSKAVTEDAEKLLVGR